MIGKNLREFLPILGIVFGITCYFLVGVGSIGLGVYLSGMWNVGLGVLAGAVVFILLTSLIFWFVFIITE